MTSATPAPPPAGPTPDPDRLHRRVLWFAAGFTFTTVALGSMVCATDSSSACPAWPVCYADQVAPGLQVGWLENPAIEFVHRVISSLCLILLAWASWLGRRTPDPRLRVLPPVALVLALGSAVFGMMIILFSLPLGLAVLDVGGATVAMLLITLAATAASAEPRRPVLPVARLGTAAFGTLLVMHLLGLLVAGRTPEGFASFTRCISWPLWQLIEPDRYPALQFVRMGLAALALGLIVAAVVIGIRQDRLRVPAVLLAVVTAAELGLGLLIRSQGLHLTQINGINLTLAVAYAVLAVTILWAVAHLTGRAGPDAPAEVTQPR